MNKKGTLDMTIPMDEGTEMDKRGVYSLQVVCYWTHPLLVKTFTCALLPRCTRKNFVGREDGKGGTLNLLPFRHLTEVLLFLIRILEHAPSCC